MLQTALLATRRAVRDALREEFGSGAAGGAAAGAGERGPVVVALSGGADSLALAAAAAYVGERGGFAAAAVVVDHGLQAGSDRVAERAASQARGLGLEPVLVRRVAVRESSEAGGPEAAARDARYAALARAAREIGAAVILTAHTRDDQAEQVLLGIARGSGARSLSGVPPRRELGDGLVVLRPFVRADPSITRVVTEAACREAGLDAWRDPQNADPAFARARVRASVLPLLERELGPGVAAALARTADLAREDAEAFDAMVAEQIEEIVEHAEAGIAVSVAALAANPAALRHRIIRRVAEAEFGRELSREHTLAIAALVTHWRGQGPVEVPGITVLRAGGRIEFARRTGSPRRRRGCADGDRAEGGGARGVAGTPDAMEE